MKVQLMLDILQIVTKTRNTSLKITKKVRKITMFTNQKITKIQKIPKIAIMTGKMKKKFLRKKNQITISMRKRSTKWENTLH